MILDYITGREPQLASVEEGFLALTGVSSSVLVTQTVSLVEVEVRVKSLSGGGGEFTCETHPGKHQKKSSGRYMRRNRWDHTTTP